MNFIPNEGIPIVDRSCGSRSVHTAEQADGSSAPITVVLLRAPCNFFIFSEHRDDKVLPRTPMTTDTISRVRVEATSGHRPVNVRLRMN